MSRDKSISFNKPYMTGKELYYIAEAKFGIPDEIAQKGWSFLPSDMRKVMTALYAISQSRTGA